MLYFLIILFSLLSGAMLYIAVSSIILNAQDKPANDFQLTLQKSTHEDYVALLIFVLVVIAAMVASLVTFLN